VSLFFDFERRAALKTPFVVMLYLITALGLGAQSFNPGTPGSAAKIPGPTAQSPGPAGNVPGSAGQSTDPASRNPGSVEQVPASMLLFNIRSAFSLSPSMVKALQTRGEEKGEKLPEKSGEEVSRSQSAPTVPIAWTDALTRSLPVAAPLDLRLMGKNLIVLLQILPIALRDPVVDLFVHGQIWLTTQDNSISYRTTMQSMSILLGSRIYFYPLGADLKSGAPVAVEIKVDRLTAR
jgi:hypothetical protein